MHPSGFRFPVLFVLALLCVSAQGATEAPTEVQMPGTQPGQVGALESPDKCNNCHADYNDAATAAAGQGEPQDEPSRGWAGGTMAQAGRDPIFWATLAVAEQDFDGVGDLCLRCHSTAGWYGGRSTPTDGSGLSAGDADGVDCDTCHTMTNPDESEHLGEMTSPFLANCSPDLAVPLKNCGSEAEGFYGSGMLSLWAGAEKLGPYVDADPRHQFLSSKFHGHVDFCASCHDVSNPVAGDLAPGNGAQPGAPGVISSQDVNGGVPNLGGPVGEKAAFNNPPYAYGPVERTFSEYKSSAFPTTRVGDFPDLPDELRVPGGSLEVTYAAALMAGAGGDYADGDPRYFSCQSCHMPPVNSAGADKPGLAIRPDLPRHDHTGASYWLVDLIRYQNAAGQLRLGGGLTAAQLALLEEGRQRAAAHLRQAANLRLEGGLLKVVNLTGHKLITGYPEGRRMWLNIRWYDDQGALLREDGAYGPLYDGQGQPVRVENPATGTPVQVESILDLDDPNLRIYEAHYAITQAWAERLIGAGLPADLPLGYDRTNGGVELTLGQLATQAAGSHHATFHFALNNFIASDSRIPPYGMRFDEAWRRNALPVPASQYGNPGPGGSYRHWDTVDLEAVRPVQAVSADVDLLYQGTSWEYVQFLAEAGEGSAGFLEEEGERLLEAWINAEVPAAQSVAGDRRMVPPFRMASVQWSATLPEPIFSNGFESP